MKTMSVTAAAAVLLGGCTAYYPLPVEHPSLAEYEARAKAPGDLPVPKTVAEARNYVGTYADKYRERRNTLRLRIYNHNDAGFLGALVGLVGGIAKAPDWAAGGAAFAGGAEIGPARYQLSVQAANYGHAEQAASCVGDELRRLSPADEKQLNDVKTGDKTIGELTLSTMRRLHGKLEDAQAKVELTTPDLSKLKQALEEVQSAKAARGKVQILSADEVYQELKTKFDACLATFPSGT